VDVERLTPRIKLSAKGPLRILCVARFEEVKGHAYLVEACRILKERGLRFECGLIGDGPLMPQIENQIKQSGLSGEVLLQGAQPYDEVIEQFSQADVVVLATAPTANGKHEGVPNVLKEAMACGVPVIATASGGIPELVDETCGILVPPRDAAAIADALQLLCSKPELRRRMGLAGRERVVREFNLNRSTAMRAELFFRSADGYRSRATPAGTRQAESVLVTQRSA
jgi:glycosyltransferase involved in cell wall biosynthesis